MKVQITDKVKGELFIRTIGKSMKNGSIVTMNEDQFYDSATQAAIQSEFLKVIDGPSVKFYGKEYINVYKNSLSFKCINRSIPSGAKFFVKEELVNDDEISCAFELGYIEQVKTKRTNKSNSDEQDSNSSVESKSPEKPKKASTKKASTKKASTKKASKKTKSIKRVGSDKKSSSDSDDIKVSVGKPPEDSQVDTHSLPEASEFEVPDGMYSHDPRGEGVKIRKTKSPKGETGDPSLDFVDSSHDSNDISFVDHEQTKEQAKKNGIPSNMFEDNVEVE